MKYFGLVLKDKDSIVYHIVMSSNVENVIQETLADGWPFSHIIEIKELEKPKWYFVEPIMDESSDPISRMRLHFSNGGHLIGLYAGQEFSIIPDIYSQPLIIGYEKDNSPIYEIGKATFLNFSQNVIVYELPLTTIDEEGFLTTNDGFLATLNFWILRYYLQFILPVEQLSNEGASIH